ncbi:MAG: DEAD/DEAH box helicase family protein [Bacilli bacterium]
MSSINHKLFSEFTVDAISNTMALRIPQKNSLKILNTILDEVNLSKKVNIDKAKSLIHDLYPLFKDFEHDFMSLTFALATGVGKTKLMGAFITYLYTNKGIRNFFVVAPNLTIYSKLKNDLGNPSPDNEKYVFKGVSCFANNKPNIWADDDYKNRPSHSLVDTESINIFIFNISKFNSDERNMMAINEYLGQSFFDYLKSLDDLVLIMDESHHYRAQSSAIAINTLRPVLGLELTATPQVQNGNKTTLFKNVVYEYPLSAAIKDGYTRTPYALTRKDVKSYNFSNEELDKTMINDGIRHHENMILELKEYSVNNNVKLVKPFMLIVCKDTNHAQKILDYVKSDAFRNGHYKDKVIMIHSNQTGSEKEENIEKLLEVEKNTNKIEIVIHVNILKEGWDVNNLYTIVPLRTATSKTLREQTVGRGLRLPFGVRTGVKMVDSVTITAHDKFDEIIEEAQKGDSIFNATGVIYVENEKEKQIVQVGMNLFGQGVDDTKKKIFGEAGVDPNNQEQIQAYDVIINTITDIAIKAKKEKSKSTLNKKEIQKAVKEDLGKRFKNNEDVQKLIDSAFSVAGEDIVKKAESKTMFIPKIKTENITLEKYIVQDFNLDLSDLIYAPIRNDILIKNMLDSKEDVQVIKGDAIDYDSINPEIMLTQNISDIGEIDYEKCSDIVHKIIDQFLDFYRTKYNEKDVRNICLMYRKDITNKIGNQLLKHLAISFEGMVEVVQGIETIVNNYYIDATSGIKNINEISGETSIRSVAYDGAVKAVTSPFKFDSNSERLFALVCENSPEVIQWLRPAANQFNITYNRGHRYEPDFVVETKDMYYLVEVKAKNRMQDPDVIAKKERAVEYCRIATKYNVANGHKGFQYLFIPHDEIQSNLSFNNLKDRFFSK